MDGSNVLIFTLKRPDVFPEGDLGVRKGFQLFLQSGRFTII